MSDKDAQNPPTTTGGMDGEIILLGTGPIEDGGDGYPNGEPLLDALIAALADHKARRAAADDGRTS